MLLGTRRFDTSHFESLRRFSGSSVQTSRISLPHSNTILGNVRKRVLSDLCAQSKITEVQIKAKSRGAKTTGKGRKTSYVSLREFAAHHVLKQRFSEPNVSAISIAEMPIFKSKPYFYDTTFISCNSRITHTNIAPVAAKCDTVLLQMSKQFGLLLPESNAFHVESPNYTKEFLFRAVVAAVWNCHLPTEVCSIQGSDASGLCARNSFLRKMVSFCSTSLDPIHPETEDESERDESFSHSEPDMAHAKETGRSHKSKAVTKQRLTPSSQEHNLLLPVRLIFCVSLYPKTNKMSRDFRSFIVSGKLRMKEADLLFSYHRSRSMKSRSLNANVFNDLRETRMGGVMHLNAT